MQTDAGRKALWKVNAPDVLKQGYEYEEDPDVCDAMEQATALFMSNGKVEESIEEIQEEGGEENVGMISMGGGKMGGQ